MNKKSISQVELFYARLLLQSGFSLIVMLVCCYKIVTAPEADGQRPVYWSALTATAASWMPSPVKPTEEVPTNDIAGNQINIERKPEP